MKITKKTLGRILFATAVILSIKECSSLFSRDYEVKYNFETKYNPETKHKSQ